MWLHEMRYRAKSWARPRRVILVVKEEGLARVLDRLDDARALDARKAYLPLRGGPPEGGEDLLRRLLQRLGVHRDDVPRGPKPRRRRR